MNPAEAAYRLTATFPREEMYGMTSQVQRSAACVPANIAEGYGRDSKGAYVQQLRAGQGSLKELETHVLLGERVAIVPSDAITPLMAKAESVGKMLRSLIRSVDQSG